MAKSYLKKGSNNHLAMPEHDFHQCFSNMLKINVHIDFQGNIVAEYQLQQQQKIVTCHRKLEKHFIPFFVETANKHVNTVQGEK